MDMLQSNSNNSCFHKGSYIELSTGAMRRIEDIRTEDFIQSAIRCHLFELMESTVVKIDRQIVAPLINITFSCDQSQINMQVSSEHPLFVYGQGWASCDPAKSFQIYALKCQQLQVGDICLSLKQRDHRLPSVYTQMANIVAAAYAQQIINNITI